MRLASQAPCVLLISPGIIKWTDMDFGLPHLVSMGGYLLREVGEARVRVELLDLNYEGTDHQTLAHRLEALGPLCDARRRPHPSAVDVGSPCASGQPKGSTGEV